MKKLLRLGFILAFVLSIASCSKQGAEEMSSEVRLMEQDSMEAQAKKPNGIEWMLYCEGDCVDCSGKGINVRPQVYECQCEEDCALKVARVQVGPSAGGVEHSALGKRQVDSLSAIYGTFQAQLSESLRDRYGLDHYAVYQVAVYATTNSYAVKYFIDDLKGNKTISLSYLKKGRDAPSFEVDCNGDCIKASAKCTERVILGDPIQMECTCEGDCKMDVTQSTELGEL